MILRQAIESTSCQLSGEIRNVGRSYLFRADGDDTVRKLMQHRVVSTAMALREITIAIFDDCEDAYEHAVTAHARLSPTSRVS